MAAPPSRELSDADWERAFALLDEARGLPAPDREAFVEAIEPESVRSEVRRLIASDEQTRVARASEVAARRRRTDGSDSAATAATVESDKHNRPVLEPARTPPKPGDLLRDGRYEIVELIGKGSFGSVFRAKDHVQGDEVAVKWLHEVGELDMPRVRREVAAMEFARIPGVVRLREGLSTDDDVIVMDLVDGCPFPGREPEGDDSRLPWSAVAPAAVSLLEVLAAVHARGLVHRDLKPDNVLVDADGSSTVMDLGLARAAELGPRLTQTAAILGSALWLAPEQANSKVKRLDGRADLYAVGVMLYRALSGRYPDEGGSYFTVLHAKAKPRRRDLGRRALDDTPPHVVTLVEDLLERDRKQRPRSADEVLRRLRTGVDGIRRQRPELPRLDPKGVLDDVVARLRAGSSVRVRGGRGAGKTRLARDVKRALREAGDVDAAAHPTVVLETVPGSRPFEAFGPLVEDMRVDGAASLDEHVETVVDHLAERLGETGVLVVDDADRTGTITPRVLAKLRERCPVLETVTKSGDTPANVELEPLAERDLRALFHGPDRFLHLREDGAHELWRRTGGVPLYMDAELDAWERGGLATWDETRFRVTVESLAQLREGFSSHWSVPPAIDEDELGLGLSEVLAFITLAWPDATVDVIAVAQDRARWDVEADANVLAERGAIFVGPDGDLRPLVPSAALWLWNDETRQAAHRALAAAHRRHTAARLRNLLAAAEHVAVAHECPALMDAMTKRGWAMSAARLGLWVAASDRGRAFSDVDTRFSLISSLAVAALTSQSRLTIAQVAAEASREPAVESVVTTLNWALSPTVRLSMAAIRREFRRGIVHRHADLEAWRWGYIARAMGALPVTAHETLIEEALGGQCAEFLRRRGFVARWKADILHRQGNYTAASREFEACGKGNSKETGAIVDFMRASGAALESGEHIRCARLAGVASRRSRAIRNVPLSVHSAYLQRAAVYRSFGSIRGVHRTVCDAAASRGLHQTAALVHLLESVIAWRSDFDSLAQDLIATSLRFWELSGDKPGHALAAAFAESIGIDAGGVFSLCDAVPGGIELQVRALAVSGSASLIRASRLRRRREARSRSPLRREVLDDKEVAELLKTSVL